MMEEMPNRTLFSLSIDPVTKTHLYDTARWARFLAIAGIVFMGLMLIWTLLALTVLPDLGFMKYNSNGQEDEELNSALKIAFGVVMILFCAIGFFPLLFLLRFANQLRDALYNNDQELLNSSFLNIKRYFRYLGVITIICLAIYGLRLLVLGLTRL